MGTVLGDFIAANRAAKTGDLSGAGAYMRQAIDKVDWSVRVAYMQDGWSVYTHEAVAGEAVFVDQAARRIVMGKPLWGVLAYHQPAVDLLLTQATQGADGMRFLTLDAGVYAEAARHSSRANGDDVVRAKDAITDVEERIGRLTVNLASLQGRATTEAQRRMLFEDFATAREDIGRLEDRLFDAKSRLELAGSLLGTIQ